MTQPSKGLAEKGAILPIKTTITDAVNEFLKQAMNKGVFDAVLIPMRVPAGDSFVYVLLQDPSLINDAQFRSPVMSVQGAKAVSSVTKLGKGQLKIAVVMRPCEVRATNELTKLEQTNLENITLISFDCPGVLPLSDFVSNPEQGMKHFDQAQKSWDDHIMRPVCQICDNSSMTAGDLHIGIHGAKQGTCFLIPTSQKGTDVLQHLGNKTDTNLDAWAQKVQKRTQEKQEKRKKAHQALHTQINGLAKFTDAFQQCINCHNCMRVCPVCYCRLCYFDSDKVKQQPEEYLNQATSKGSIRFLPDTTLFHIGRMTHMSLSCVSCGSCEDACPMSIPVAQIFSMIADETQAVFDYVAGKSIEEPLPLRTFKEDELHDMEDAHD